MRESFDIKNAIRLSVFYCVIYSILFIALPVFIEIMGKPGTSEFYNSIYEFFNKYLKALDSPASAIFAVSLVIVSIKLSGSLSDFYSRITGFGITDVRVNRKGQDPHLTQMWIDRIKDCENVLISGTSSRGWFVKAKEELAGLLSDSGCKIKKLEIYILDPFGGTWQVRVKLTDYPYEHFIQQYQQVTFSLISLAESYPDTVEVYFYDTEPVSFVMAGDKIYYGMYFPLAERKNIPELTISKGGFLGSKLGSEMVEKMSKIKRRANVETLKDYHNTLMRLHGKESEYSSIETLNCDFCKERSDLPTIFTKTYPNNEKGGKTSLPRIIKQYDGFFVVPTLGQITDNYLLIASNRHVTASSQLSAYEHDELKAIKNSIESTNASNGFETFFFEHGMPYANGCFGGCGISHLHIHAIPIKEKPNIINLAKEFLDKKNIVFDIKELSVWSDLDKLWDRSYISLKVNNEIKAFVFTDTTKIESQLMRQFLADLHNQTSWDWREYSNEYDKLIAVKTLYSKKL